MILCIITSVAHIMFITRSRCCLSCTATLPRWLRPCVWRLAYGSRRFSFQRQSSQFFGADNLVGEYGALFLYSSDGFNHFYVAHVWLLCCCCLPMWHVFVASVCLSYDWLFVSYQFRHTC